MRIILRNRKSKIVLGGVDYLTDIRERLLDYFTVDDTGYDRCFISKDWEILTGLIPYVVDVAEELGVGYVITDERTNIIKFRKKVRKSFKGIKLFDDQYKCLKSLRSELIPGITWNRGIIDAATNFGKSYVIAGLLENIKYNKALVLIHSIDIFEEFKDFFPAYFDTTIFGKDIALGKLTIAMKKTLLNRSKKNLVLRSNLAEVDLLIIDESHLAASNDYLKLNRMISANSRYYFSGTALRMGSGTKKLNLIGNSGPVVFRIKNKKLIKNNRSSSVKVIMYNNYCAGFSTTFSNAYSQHIKFSKSRINLIRNHIATNIDKQVIIACKFIDHCKFLANQIPGAVILTGQSKDREQIKSDFKAGKIKILITTILKEGVNMPNIGVLILAFGGKDVISILQYIGRLLRKGEIKKCQLVDFYDRFRWLEDHSIQRLKLYNAEGFKIKRV